MLLLFKRIISLKILQTIKIYPKYFEIEKMPYFFLGLFFP